MTTEITNGVFYTDKKLAQFAAWFAGDLLPKDRYTLLDPCCGSGNLFLNNPHLGSPTIIASDLNPTLPHAIQANFLTVSAKEYLDLLPPIDKTKPLLIFVNPPYRGDAGHFAESISYEVHPSIKAVTGGAGALERCNCFMVQLVNVVKQLNIPTQLIFFSKCSWLGTRSTFQSTKDYFIKHFEFNNGFIINSKEFFKCKGKFPIAVTVWKYCPDIVEPNPIVNVVDLTHIKKKDLVEDNVSALLNNAKEIAFGVKRDLLKLSFNLKRTDFIRNRKKHEIGDPLAGGLPLNDRRRANKSTYGESTGTSIGFMDDLTPCRIKSMNVAGAPCFHLNPQFMHVKINRCFSGPPNCRSYHAPDLDSAQKCFVWYALARTFRTCGYPMWADAEELWAVSSSPDTLSSPSSFTPANFVSSRSDPSLLTPSDRKLIDYAFAIGFAENECVETVFPANNPVEGALEISISNPMTPNDPRSFWNCALLPAMSTTSRLVEAVNCVYGEWATRFDEHTPEIKAPFTKPYFIEQGVLRKTAGLIQIQHYAEAMGDEILLELDGRLRKELKDTKQEFYEFLTDKDGINYFEKRK